MNSNRYDKSGGKRFLTSYTFTIRLFKEREKRFLTEYDSVQLRLAAILDPKAIQNGDCEFVHILGLIDEYFSVIRQEQICYSVQVCYNELSIVQKNSCPVIALSSWLILYR